MSISNSAIWTGISLATILTWASNTSARPDWGSPRTLKPIISASWLQANANRANLVILDVRPEQNYREGHIPKSVSAPFQIPESAWVTMKDDLLLEIPSQTVLFATLGSLGILPSSWVVVVSAPNPGEPASYGFSAATRVAQTLIYAGVTNASVLDGGYPQWIAQGGSVATDIPIVSPVAYSGEARSSIFVSTQYVKEHIGRSTLLDARGSDVYFGVTIEPFADKAGHIPSAKSLPTPWLWSTDGIFKEPSVLGRMVSGVAGWFGGREIIVYCGVGGYASAAWFVLTQVLGYPNVKFYDGSVQLWAKTEPMIPYRWE